MVWKGLNGVQVNSSGSVEDVYKLASVVIRDVFGGKYGEKKN
jgi:hypothetical protein